MIFTAIHNNLNDGRGQPAQWIPACINGDRHAQSKLYEHFVTKMFAVCMRYAKNREEAEEILQEGFIQVFRSLHSFRNEGSFEGWIRQIMVHNAIKYFRSKPKVHLLVHMETLQSEQAANDETFATLQKKELLKLIQALPPAYRLVFNLYVFEGMKHREIAAQLGISEGTSKSNLYDARTLLQKAVTRSLRIMKNY